MEKAGSLDRFLALVRREFGATDARLLSPDDVAPVAENAVICDLEDGRKLVVAFDAPCKDREVIERRLRILADTFAESLGSAQFRARRAAVPISLAEELRTLAHSANAEDAVVIDVDSPVVWGSAIGAQLSRSEPPPPPPAVVSRPQLLSGEYGDSEDEGPTTGTQSNAPPRESDSAPMPVEATSVLARRAIAHLRGLPDIAASAHRGKYVRHAHVESDLGYVATSFSSIYLLVLVFSGSFDEMRAERTAQDALPRVEKLVLALPPLDPEPEPFGQAVSFRRRRR